jgi:TM2 domain-containing membrane protein YozV
MVLWSSNSPSEGMRRPSRMERGKMFCSHCGNEIAGGPAFCPHCGARLLEDPDASPKSRLATSLLCALPAYFFWVNGVHRFYLGKIGTGLLMLFTLGGLGIWTTIDFIFVVTGNMKDKDGKLIKKW